MKLQSKQAALVVGALMFAALSGLAAFAAWATGEIDWWRASADGGKTPLIMFAARFPHSWHTPAALERIAALVEREDADAWKHAESEDTADGFREYLAKFPGGTHSDKATLRLKSNR